MHPQSKFKILINKNQMTIDLIYNNLLLETLLIIFLFLNNRMIEIILLNLLIINNSETININFKNTRAIIKVQI